MTLPELVSPYSEISNYLRKNENITATEDVAEIFTSNISIIQMSNRKTSESVCDCRRLNHTLSKKQLTNTEGAESNTAVENRAEENVKTHLRNHLHFAFESFNNTGLRDESISK